MPRRAIFLVLILFLAAVLLLGGLIWHAFSSSPAPAPNAPAAPPRSRTAALPLGPAFRANTVLADPFADDPNLAATKVSLDLDQAEVQDAFDELATAASGSASPLKFAPFDRPKPRIDIHLDQQPWLEAYLQFQAQASVLISIAPGPELSAQYTQQRVLPGTWCVSGPFAFLITAINHSASIGTDGQPAPRFAGEPPESFYLTVTTMAEPKLRLLQYPGQLQLIEATDDHGHSLIPTGTPAGSARFARPLSPYFPTVTCPLVYPQDQPGRTITRLKATAQVLVEAKSETLEIADPMDEQPASKTVAGMTVSVGKLVWNPQSHWMTLEVTYQRGTVDPMAWETLCPALVKARLNLLPAGRYKRSAVGFRSSNEVANTITTRYTIPSDNMQSTTPPKFTKLTLDIPTAVKQLTVPLEFKDLPLP